MKGRSGLTWGTVKGKAAHLYAKGKHIAFNVDMGLKVARQFLPLLASVNPELGGKIKDGYDKYELARERAISAHDIVKNQYDGARKAFPSLNLP